MSAHLWLCCAAVRPAVPVCVSTLLVLAAGGGCSLVAPAPFDDDKGGLRIVSVDGDGSATPVVGAPAGLAGVAADHRVARRLRVVVAGKDGGRPPTIDEAFFVDGDDRVSADVQDAGGNREDGVVFVSLPAALPLRSVLTLTLVAGAARADAQVFFLQGEPGPPGPRGEDGAPALVAEDAVDDVACPFGGRTLRFGTDADGDGVLGPDETTVRRLDCDVVVQGARTLAVADEAALRAALRALSAVRLAPGSEVTLQLAAGALPFADTLVVDHVDGERILLAGAPTTTGSPATTLVFPAGRDGVVVTGGLRLRQLAIDSPDIDDQQRPVLAGVGLQVRDGGFVVVEADEAVVVRGFDFGVDVVAGGVLVVREGSAGNAVARPLQVVGNDNGASVSAGGVLFATALLARDNRGAGVVATGGQAFVRAAHLVGNPVAGVLAQFGGYVDAIAAVVDQPAGSGAGVSAVQGGVVLCNQVTVDGGQFVVQAFDEGVVSCERATLNGPARAALGGHLVTSDSRGTNLRIGASEDALVLHRCSNAADAACTSVPCDPLDGGQCFP